MNVRIKQAAGEQEACAALIVGHFENASQIHFAQSRRLQEFCQTYVKTPDFSGKKGETLLLFPGEGIKAKRILLVGLGAEADFSVHHLRVALGAAVKPLTGKGVQKVTLLLDSLLGASAPPEACTRAAVEGLIMGNYDFDAYRSDKSAANLTSVTVLLESLGASKELKKAAQEARLTAGAVNFARDLQNQPPNRLTPGRLAQIAKKVSEKAGLKCTVLNKQDMQKLKMGALLGVARGSEQPPKLIVLKHKPAKSAGKPVVLVGKGVTFDSGGLSLKPASSMEEMKFDMSGAAAVLATLKAVAEMKLPVPVVGIVPAVENLPSGSAVKPGDILTAANGTTIEVLNTDAEGRLILADALHYAGKFKPEAVIDLATLTGACVVALGNRISGLMGNDQALLDELHAAGEASGDRAWQLPLREEFYEDIKGDYADIKNTAGRPAGAITAAAFLGSFTRDYLWAHLDIAGTAYASQKTDFLPKGGTGAGVRLLLEYLRKKAGA